METAGSTYLLELIEFHGLNEGSGEVMERCMRGEKRITYSWLIHDLSVYGYYDDVLEGRIFCVSQ